MQLPRSAAAIAASWLVLASASALADPYPPLWGSPAVHFAPVAWPSEPADPKQCGPSCGEWLPYTRFQKDIADPRTQDPSNGGTAPQNYVNIASSCVDKTFPSIYYALREGAAADGSDDIVMFRWRVEQIANTYATGPSAGTYGASDPWNSALWSVLFDVDGDGFIDLAAHLDGSSGAPATAVDRIVGIWSKLPTQSLDYVGDPANVKLLAHNPTAFVDPATNRILNFQGTLSPTPNWPNGAVETRWDYGTTRSRVVSTSPCNEYFIDYQIPVRMLDASSLGGPKITRSTPISMLFCTANSLNNPFQKDCAINRKWTGAGGQPGPFGDYVSFNQSAAYAQPIVSSVTASAPSSCPGTYSLAAKVQDTLAVIDGHVVPSVRAVRFFYYYDADGNGLADDGNAWTFAVDAALLPGSLNTWTATWDATALAKGQYLIGVQAVDDNTKVDDGMLPTGIDNRTFSYVAGDAENRIEVGGVAYASMPAHSPPLSPGASENWWGNPSVTGTQTALVGLANNACGLAPTLVKAASTANVAPGGIVDFTLTLANPLASPITLSELADDLPAGFTFAGTTGGSLTPTTSPASGASGSVAWTFSPAATIAPGGSATLVFRTSAPSVAGNYNNAASATTSFGALASAPVGIAVDTARLTLTKTPNRYNVDPDGVAQVVYTLAYANASTVAVTNATISDALPAGVSYVTCSGGATCTQGGGVVTWSIGALPAGASGSAPLTVTVDPGYAGASLGNAATLTASDPAGNPLSQSASTTIAVNHPMAGAPAFTLAKSAGATQIAPGGTATWTIAYANVGDGAASGVTIADALPAGFTFANCSGGAACSSSAGTVTWNVGSVAAGASGTVAVTATAANPFTSPNPAANTASVDWTENSGTPVVASAAIGVTGQACSNYYFHALTADVGIDGVRDVATTTRPSSASAAAVNFNATTTPVEAVRFYQDPPAPASVAFSGNIATSFYVTKSSGPQLKMDVYVYDYDPASGTKTALGTQSFTQTGSGTNQLFTFTLPLSGTLTKGHRILWVFNAYSNNNTTFTFNFDGTASPSGASFCVTPPPNLTLAKSVDKAAASAGSAIPVRYTLQFANTGQTKTTGTQLVDTLPANVTFGAATLNGAPVTPTQSGQQLTFANVTSSTDAVAGEVAPGALGSIVIDATIDAAASGALTNQASIASNETTPVASSATTTLSAASGGGGTPALAVSLAADRSSAVPGDVVTYTVAVVNVGSASADNVQLTDTLPLASYYAFGTCSGGCTNGGGTLSWNVGTLAVATAATYTFTMQAGSAGLPAGVTVMADTATVQATSVPPVTSETVDVVLNGNPRLVLAKSATPSTGLAPGASVNWTLTVTNAGNAPAADVRVVDPIPAASTFAGNVAASPGSGAFDAVGNRMVFDVGTLAAGASATLGFTTTIGALPPGMTTLSNAATASAANAASTSASATASASAAPALVLQKQAPGQVAYPAATLAAPANGATLLVDDASQLVPGGYVSIAGNVVQVQEIAGHVLTLAGPVVAAPGTPVIAAIGYALTVTNTGNAVANDATLTDPLPSGATFVAASDGATFAGGAVSWNLGDLAAGASRTVFVTLLPGSAGTMVNAASVACTACAPIAASVGTSAGGLRVTKRTTTPTTRAGGTATYVIDAENTSGAPIANVQIDDTLPPGFSYSSTTSIMNDGASVAASVLPTPGDTIAQWGGFSVGAGKRLTITFIANVSPTAGAATYENPASASPSAVAYDPLTSTADDVTVLAANTGIVQGRVYRDNDDDGAYDAAVDTPLAGVAVTITDATSTTYVVTTDADGTFVRVVAAGTASVDVDDSALPAGVALRAGFADPSFVVVPDGASPTRDVAYVVAGAVADVVIALSHAGTFTQGQAGAAYTLIVSNIGGGATVGAVSVVDTLPIGLTATAMGGPGWSCDVATLACTRNDSLAAGASYPPIALTVSVAADAPSSVTNEARVSGGGEANVANDAAADPATVTPVVVPPPAAVAPTPVPTLAELALALLAGLVVGSALLARRRVARR